MAKRIIVVDYGVGNLYSVQRALEVSGAEEIVLSSDPQVIAEADRVVLPGVGAFADGMRGLRERALVEPIKAYAQSGRPLLGICLGMQMLATASEEFGEHQGLGIVPGRVKPVPRTTVQGTRQKTPHIGWASLLLAQSRSDWNGSILDHTPQGTAVYLVHSYSVVPDDLSHRLADCDYGGHRLCAALRVGNVFGTQFHPEKSGRAGLEMLSRFLAL